MPDVTASILLTGKFPKIVDAFRLEPIGTLKELRSTKLRGMIDIDPRTQDFFKMVIEERKRTDKRTDLSEIEKKRLSGALKVFANSTSYGIYAEMNRQESEQKISVRCHGIDAKPYTCKAANPEKPGEYCFSPLASLITGGARLMLALLEYSVTKLGGTYAMEDTDSMAIVATEKGGLIQCPGGPHRLRDNSEAVKALSWKQVAKISKRFESLRLYDPSAIPSSILKIEEDNYDPNNKKQRQLWCYAISAKRYALFVVDEQGNPTLLREKVNSDKDHWSQHGLGYLLNPIDPDSDDRKWIAQLWLNMIRNSLGLPRTKISFVNIPAIGRITVSSPAVLLPLKFLNKEKRYSDQIKPFNFLLSCHVRPLGHPIGVDPTKFHLIAPFELDSRKWLRKEWIDQYSGKTYLINTAGNYSSPRTARVKTFSEVIEDYEFHPEAKCADTSGNACGKQTTGLLRRRHIKIDQINYIGKESNSLEEVDLGTIHSVENVYTEYIDLRRDVWTTKIIPEMKKTTLSELMKETGLSRRMLIKARNCKVRPHRANQLLIVSALRKLRNL